MVFNLYMHNIFNVDTYSYIEFQYSSLTLISVYSVYIYILHNKYYVKYERGTVYIVIYTLLCRCNVPIQRYL